MVVVKNSLPAPACWDNASQDDSDAKPTSFLFLSRGPQASDAVDDRPGPWTPRYGAPLDRSGNRNRFTTHQDLSDGHGPLDLTR